MIVGAGLAGLIAAHYFQTERIYERDPEPKEDHKALLRFRSDKVAQLTGIDFTPVTVRKGIWYDGKFVAPTIKLANMYSQKCLNGLIEGERSIWRLDPVTRWIAPENFYEQLIKQTGTRITWDSEFNFKVCGNDRIVFKGGGNCISTVPMPVVLKALNIEPPDAMVHSSIHIMRYKIENCNTHQTIYFPGSEHKCPIYRASITGDAMIIECTVEPMKVNWQEYDIENYISNAFQISIDRFYSLKSSDQRYGKIATIDDAKRKEIIGRLTNEFNIFSVGRFATWKNILLDDVVDDLAIVKRLIKSTTYERNLHRNKN